MCLITEAYGTVTNPGNKLLDSQNQVWSNFST